jgi:hypothetical protein
MHSASPIGVSDHILKFGLARSSFRLSPDNNLPSFPLYSVCGPHLEVLCIEGQLQHVGSISQSLICGIVFSLVRREVKANCGRNVSILGGRGQLGQQQHRQPSCQKHPPPCTPSPTISATSWKMPRYTFDPIHSGDHLQLINPFVGPAIDMAVSCNECNR